MSRSLYINFRNKGFWAYDVPSSVFLKFLIDAATDRLASGTDQWLGGAIKNWRISAAISDLSHYADDEWSPPQVDTVIELCRTATNAIRGRGDIPAREIESWPILDDQRMFTRGHDPVPCEPVARLGDAFIALLQDTLPEPPERHWWFFTLDENTDTIAMRSDA
jgi:hypothetical protein